MVIALAGDHGGFLLKEAVQVHLEGRGIQVLDLGTHSEESVDYPVYGKRVAQAVVGGEADLGIAFCGTGIGISISCNKVKGVRCALVTTPFMAEMAKRHNNANILALGGRVLEPEQAFELIDIWLDGTFEEERHARRVRLLDEMGCQE